MPSPCRHKWRHWRPVSYNVVITIAYARAILRRSASVAANAGRQEQSERDARPPAPDRGCRADLAIDYRPVASLIPYARNARTHSEAQVALIAGSIREFGFTNPVLVDGDERHHRRPRPGAGGAQARPRLGAGDRARATSARRRSAPTSSPTTGSPSRPAGTASCWRWSSATCADLGIDLGTLGFEAARARRAARHRRARPARGGDARAAGGAGFPSTATSGSSGRIGCSAAAPPSRPTWRGCSAACGRT